MDPRLRDTSAGMTDCLDQVIPVLAGITKLPCRCRRDLKGERS